MSNPSPTTVPEIVPCDECHQRGWFSGPKCCGNTVNGECRASCAVEERTECKECFGKGSYDANNLPFAKCEGCSAIIGDQDEFSSMEDAGYLCAKCTRDAGDDFEGDDAAQF